MTIYVRLPPALSERIGSPGLITVTGAHVIDCLQSAVKQFPELGKILWRETDQLNPVILIFLNEDLLRASDLNRAASDGDNIDVIPAIEGGESLRKTI